MSRKLPPIDFHALFALYQSGKSSDEIAREAAIGKSTLLRHWHALGYTLQKRPSDAVLRSLYVDQRMTSSAIAPRFGVSQKTVCQWIREIGITRSPQEAARLKIERCGADAMKQGILAAQETVRGMKRTAEDLERRARGKERTRAHQSELERALLAMLPPEAIPCKAIGPYNVDIALGNVAVEVYGGLWHASGRALARWPTRIRYLLDHGWGVIVVWVHAQRYPLSEEAARFIIRQRTVTPPQYHVIRGNGVHLLSRFAHSDDFPVLPSHSIAIR